MFSAALAAGDLEGTRADRGVTLASVEAYESGGRVRAAI